MRIKKRTLVAAVCVFMCALVLMCGCEREQTTKDNGKIKIVTSAFPQYDLVREIAGDAAEVKMLLPVGSEVHTYDPSVNDIMNVASCDVFVYNGGESDAWVESVIVTSENTQMIKFAFMENCTLINEIIVDGMQHDEQKEVHGHDEAEFDEHVWTSPVKLSEIANALCETLCEVDGKNSETYRQNTKQYAEQLSELDEALRQVRQEAVRDTIVFGDRFPFAYFAKEYNLKYYAAFPGCASNTEASAKTLAFLSDKVKKEKIPVVFTIEFSDGKIADAVASSSGAKKLLFHSCHNVTGKQLDEGVTYISLMYENVNSLREAICS